MPELKAGDVKIFELGGKQLIVQPLTFGNIKKLLRILMEVSEKGKAGDADILSIPILLDNYADTAIPLLFRKEKHEFLTKEWIDEYLTILDLTAIVQAVAAVNGLSDFFGKTATINAPEAVETKSAIPQTPPESSDSTTSSGKPTDGSPEKSTE